MLSDTLTLGLSANQLVFSKRFADANISTYSVAGLALTAARTMSVSHQGLSNGGTRTMISLDETDVDPNSPSTATRTGISRVYLVIQRQPWKSSADVKSAIARLKTLVDDTAFQDKILNQEV